MHGVKEAESLRWEDHVEAMQKDAWHGRYIIKFKKSNVLN